MPLRLLLILVLVVQQLALPVAVWGAAPAGACVETSCCQVVETTTCCGETTLEMRCGKTGGQECRCDLQPDDPAPTPEAPRPSDRNEIVPILVAAVGGVIDLRATVRWQAPSASPAIVRTHNETRALLCIWRT